MMFPGPMTRDQLQVSGVGLIEGRIINDQDTGSSTHLGLNFVPKGIGVGFEAVQQSGEGIVGGWSRPFGLHAGRLGGGVGQGGSKEEVDVVFVMDFGGIHTPTVRHNPRARKPPILPTA